MGAGGNVVNPYIVNTYVMRHIYLISVQKYFENLSK
jgi:hypothetical protein